MNRTERDQSEAERIERWQQGVVEWLGPEVCELLRSHFESHDVPLAFVRALIERARHPAMFTAACEIYWCHLQRAVARTYPHSVEGE